MSTITKIVLGIYLFSTFLITLFSEIHLYFQSNFVFLIILILTFLVSYSMPIWLRLLLKAKSYSGEYRKQLLDFSKERGFQLEHIYIVDNKHSNAFTCGLWNKKSVFFNSFTLEKHPWDEIEACMAHELGHHAHNGLYIYTILISTILIVMSFVNVLIYNFLSQNSFTLFLICLVTSALLLPVISFISRTMEGQADIYAKKTLKDPSSFGRFLERLVENEKKLGETVPENPPLFVQIFFTHPWFFDRIKFMENKS